MTSELIFIILVGLSITLLVYIILSLVFLGHASAFNMTKQMIKDDQMATACQILNISSEECNKVYGGIPYQDDAGRITPHHKPIPYP